MKRGTSAIGYTAGILIAVSALPQIIECMHEPAFLVAQSIPRNAMLVAGNLLWIYYGHITRARPIVFMCCIGAILNGVVLVAAINARV